LANGHRERRHPQRAFSTAPGIGNRLPGADLPECWTLAREIGLDQHDGGVFSGRLQQEPLDHHMVNPEGARAKAVFEWMTAMHDALLPSTPKAKCLSCITENSI
jgi:hypothetical protein